MSSGLTFKQATKPPDGNNFLFGITSGYLSSHPPNLIGAQFEELHRFNQLSRPLVVDQGKAVLHHHQQQDARLQKAPAPEGKRLF
jgi:hypothetical protein